jgi:hypothetical protein
MEGRIITPANEYLRGSEIFLRLHPAEQKYFEPRAANLYEYMWRKGSTAANAATCGHMRRFAAVRGSLRSPIYRLPHVSQHTRTTHGNCGLGLSQETPPSPYPPGSW